MKKVTMLIALFITCLTPLDNAFAGTCPDPGWNETGKVEGVEVSQGDRLKIKFDWSTYAVAICKIGGSTTGSKPATAEMCKAWLSQALTALAAGKSLIINHDVQASCQRDWGGLTDNVESVYLK